MIQTMYDIIKIHRGVLIAIGIKAQTKDGEESVFTIQLPII
jgi:hypothetical protein